MIESSSIKKNLLSFKAPPLNPPAFQNSVIHTVLWWLQLEELIPLPHSSSTCFMHLTYQVFFTPCLQGLILTLVHLLLNGMTGQVRGQPLQPLGHGVIDNQRLNKQRARPQAVSGNLITHPALSPGTGWQVLEKAAAGHSHHWRKEELGQRVNFSGAPVGKQHFCIVMDPDGREAVHKEQFSSTGSKVEYFRLKCILSVSLRKAVLESHLGILYSHE